MIELVALEVDFRAAEMFGQPFGEIKRAWPPGIIPQQIIQFFPESPILLGVIIGLFQIEDQRHQRFGDETAAKYPKMAVYIRAAAQGVLSIAHKFSSAFSAYDDNGSVPEYVR